MVEMRIEQRGSEWVVLPESGDKVLGTHKTKADAEKQLAAIEASKHAHHARFTTFEVQRGLDGKVRTGVWDRICVPGHDEKDGQSTDFDLDTLSQMVDNLVERGDPIPIDHNHQSNYASTNGMPAPALGWYGALAVVWDGKLAKSGALEGVNVGAGPDLSRDGLWGLRTEVTEYGEQLLPNFKLLSPTFTPQGVRRDGSECGYQLAAVAATNTPWQSGTEITFETGATSTKTGADASKKEGVRMSPEMLAKLGLEEGHSPEAAGEAFAKYMGAAEERMAKLAKMEEDEKAKMDEAEMADDGKKAEMADDGEKSKMDADGDDDGDKQKMEKDEKDGDEKAKMAVMETTIKALATKLARFEKSEAAREKAESDAKERTFEQLADSAIAGGYDKTQRGALIKFARTDFEGARAAVAHLLPKNGAPAHLFDSLSRQGGPATPGASSAARGTALAAAKAKKVRSPFGDFVEDDAEFAQEIKRVAESKDPILMEKVDKLLPAAHRPMMYQRLMAAERVVRAENPELAESAE